MDITSSVDIRELNERIHQQSAFIDLLTMELNKAVVGQKTMVERLLIGLLANGHVLLEGVPGTRERYVRLDGLGTGLASRLFSR